ncbi:hypothetical protein QYE76_058373 [Lolium multiflorum]|uniref:F-box domain-containing protein n=1 Tax=Lolium multiflorum TaxID=4521 RepID=A0AAD8T6G1_LOLMU|nr:hypothetical protein QYE76_058373 [Lolium multiflorum]
MAGGDDRLSELPDDLLRRVLHFVPLKEAASTTALSRRWRAPLWLSSGGVNLETGMENVYYSLPRRDDFARFFSRRDAYISAAVRTLDAADVPATRLTMRLDSDLNESVDEFLSWPPRNMDEVVSSYTNLIDVGLSHRAARSVEELRIDANDTADEYSLFDNWGCLYTVTLHTLPLETLRALELTSCKGLLYPRQATAIVLPRLSSLQLSHCEQHLSSLQRVIDAAPALDAVHLESVLIDVADKDDAPPTPSPNARCLRCPAAKVLVLDSCTWEEKKYLHTYGYDVVDVDGLKIDAPRLRRFRYKGPFPSFSFSPRPLEWEQVDLDFSGRANNGKKKDLDRDLDTFWRFARSFTSTKEMRLKVNNLEDIAVLTEARRVELLPAFRRLQRLEIQGAHSTKGRAATLIILNMLRCCPVLTALRINLTAAEQQDNASNEKGVAGTRIPQKEIQIAALLGPSHLYQCLKSSLTRVGLQFRLGKSDCLGLKLIKFLAENAMVLKEMYIDGGDQNLCEQMNPKTEKWNSKRRKSGATSFVILPLKR